MQTLQRKAAPGCVTKYARTVLSWSLPLLSPARRAAFEILRLVEGGAHSTGLLHTRAAALEPRDASLAHELVLGTLRRRLQLDFLTEHFSGRAAAKLDGEVRLALHLGIYQLRHLDRIPAHAAISESVELVRRAHLRSATGFVNAVLRKVNRKPVPWPDRSTELSTPAWMLARWDAQFGAETAERIAKAFLQPSETWLRIPPGATPPEGAEPTDLPGCYRWTARTPPPAGFRQQDIGSQCVVPLLALEPHHRLLDLCAAPGGKTAQAREVTPRIVACDRSLARLRAMPDADVPLVNLDAASPLPFRPVFDRILADAPCSGTGTIGRNPEIRWRLDPSEIARHQERQRRLLANALAALAPEGKLVYSTCSLEAEENEAVLAALPDGWQVERTLRRTPGIDPGDGFFAALISRRPS
jgi:16S rRNA (cytosine967-C5)-methyltransferase